MVSTGIDPIHAQYHFHDNTFSTRGYTWAASIIPKSPRHDHVCTTCGAVNHSPSGAYDVIVEGGTKYPDILGCGAYPFLIVSEKVIGVWQAAGINCFHTYPVNVAGVRSKPLRNITPPAYFSVEIEGSCRIDPVASGFKVIRICPECHRVIAQPVIPDEHRYVMENNSWDGSPLFRDPIQYPCVSFCTQQVLELAGQHHLTNFYFENMDVPLYRAGKGIDYLKLKPRK
jgi:hypothetical protein